MDGRRAWAWPVGLAVAGAATLVALVVGAPAAADLGSALLQVALNAVLAGASVRAASRSQGRLRKAWALVAGAAVLTVAVILGLVGLLLAGRPIPATDDLWWLLVLVNLLSFGGLLWLSPPEIRGASALRFALDGLIVGTAILFMLLAGVEQWQPGATGGSLVLLAYPAIDAAVLTVVLLVLSRRGRHVPLWYALISGSFALVLATDAIGAAWPDQVVVADVGYFVQLGLAAAAARLSAPWPPVTGSAERLSAQWAVYVPFGLSVVAAIADYRQHHGLAPGLFLLAVLAVSMVMARTVVLLGENARLASSLRESAAFKTQLLRFISHEVANPLSPLRLQAHLLHDGKAKEPDRAWETIERSILRLETLSTDVRLMALAETQRLVKDPAPADLAPRVEAAVQAHQGLAEQRGLRLLADLSPVTVPVDGVRFDQVVDNLLSNALKFTPAGGQVTVRLAATPAGARLEVQDSGVGLTDEQRERLFTAFGRQHGDANPGLGLGLYLCKAIVDGHGGRITAASDGTGKGSTFRVELPAAPRTPEAQLPPRPRYPGPAPA